MFSMGQIPHSFNMRPARVKLDINPSGNNSGEGCYEGERKMGINEDKVGVTNIYEGGGRGDGGMGGLGAAAMVAALGARNERGGWGGDGFGFGGGGAGLLALALLAGNGGFGGFGGRFFDRGHDRDCCEGIGQQIILNKLGSIEGAIPLSALQTQNSILEQTNALSGAIGALALGSQQGFANTKDSVQASAALLGTAIAGTKDAIQNGLFLTNTNLLEGVCSIKTEVGNQTDRVLAALQNRWTAEDQARIVAQANEIVELRQDRDARGRHADLELKITNTNTAVAAQQQAQQQFQLQDVLNTVRGLVPVVSALVNESQIARAVNSNLIVGSTGVVTGPQTANPTNVRA